MQPRKYEDLSPLGLLELAIWREARGESIEGKRAVAYSIRNRVMRPGWWGHDYHSVILKPFQYSSFNANDVNSDKWPSDNDPTFAECCQVAMPLLVEHGGSDPTSGATHYFDTSIAFPKAWGHENEWENTLNIGKLRFWKMKPAVFTTHDAVQGAVTGDYDE